MIVCKDGTVRIEGKKVEVLAEVTLIIHTVYEKLVEQEGEEATEEQFKDIFRLAKMSKEELEEAIILPEEVEAELELSDQEPSLYLS